MVRKQNEQGENVQIIEHDIEEEKTPDEMAIDGLLAELGAQQDAMATVYRVKDANGRPLPKRQYLFKQHPSGFSLDDLRDDFGGGEFQLFISKEGKLYRNVTVSVAAPKKQNEIAGVNSKQNNDNEFFYRMMQEQKESQQNMIQMMMGMMQSMFQGLQHIQQPQTNNQPSITDLMQVLVQMKEFSGNGNQSTSHKEMMEMLFKGIEIAKEMNSGGDSTGIDLLRDTLKTFGTPIAQMAQQYKFPDVKQPQRRFPSEKENVEGIKQNNISTNDNVNSEQNRNSEMNFLKLMIQNQLKFLKVQAAADKDPELYAEVLLDQVPDMYFNQFVSYLKDENCINRLVEIDPEIANYKTWFENVRQHIIAILDEMSEDIDTSSDAVENTSQSHKSESNDAARAENTTQKNNDSISGDS